jgi:hypothetical protein
VNFTTLKTAGLSGSLQDTNSKIRCKCAERAEQSKSAERAEQSKSAEQSESDEEYPDIIPGIYIIFCNCPTYKLCIISVVSVESCYICLHYVFMTTEDPAKWRKSMNQLTNGLKVEIEQLQIGNCPIFNMCIIVLCSVAV